jgi:hypothetical protein
MAKFGLFEGGVDHPQQEYEGEFLTVSNESVAIIAKASDGRDHIFAVIRLAQGQSVKMVKEQK